MKLKVKIKNINDDTYLIPNTKEDLFDKLAEHYWSCTEYSDEQDEVSEEIYSNFDQYKIEDLNEIQLYIDSKDK